MCLIVTAMLATCLGLSILGYYQHQHRRHQIFRRGSCRLPCHMKQRHQQLCPRGSYLRDGTPKEVLMGQPPKVGAALVGGDIGYWQGMFFYCQCQINRS